MILYGAEIEYVHVKKNLKGGFNEKFLKQCTKLDPSKRRCNTFSLNAYLWPLMTILYREYALFSLHILPASGRPFRSSVDKRVYRQTMLGIPRLLIIKQTFTILFLCQQYVPNYLISTQKRLLEAASVEMNDLIVLSVPILNFVWINNE